MLQIFNASCIIANLTIKYTSTAGTDKQLSTSRPKHYYRVINSVVALSL